MISGPIVSDGGTTTARYALKLLRPMRVPNWVLGTVWACVCLAVLFGAM